MTGSSCSLVTTEDEAPDDEAQQRRRSLGLLCRGGHAEEEGWLLLLERERELWRAGEGRCSSQKLAAAIGCWSAAGSSNEEGDGWKMERGNNKGGGKRMDGMLATWTDRSVPGDNNIEY